MIVAAYQAGSFSQTIAASNEWSGHILTYKQLYLSLTLTLESVSPSGSGAERSAFGVSSPA